MASIVFSRRNTKLHFTNVSIVTTHLYCIYVYYYNYCTACNWTLPLERVTCWHFWANQTRPSIQYHTTVNNFACCIKPSQDLLLWKCKYNPEKPHANAYSKHLRQLSNNSLKNKVTVKHCQTVQTTLNSTRVALDTFIMRCICKTSVNNTKLWPAVCVTLVSSSE